MTESALDFTVVVNRRSRSLRLHVKPTGQVEVRVPPYVGKNEISKFVQQHWDWVEATKAKLAAKTVPVTKDAVLLFGKKYQLVMQDDPQAPVGFRVEGEQLVWNYWHQAHYQKQLQTFLKATAEKYLVPRTHQWAAQMKIQFGTITLREQKSRWGSCSSQGNLNFNWRLVHYAPAIIDYVIIHELAHRTHMNHSAAFWAEVGKYDPEFRLHRGWLKRHGLTVG